MPTEAALELRPYAEALAASAAALLRAASGRGVGTRGTVRITTSEVVGAKVLPLILAWLQQKHRGLVIELVLSNRTEDLLRRDADIAVRMVRPAQKALVARRLGEIELGLHAHRDYLDRCGAPAVLDDLRTHAPIGFDRENAFIRDLRARDRAAAGHVCAARRQRPRPARRHSRGLRHRRLSGRLGATRG